MREVGRARRLRADLAGGGPLDDATVEGMDALAASLSRIVAVDMPMVIAVEDLHLMDPTLAELLRTLAQAPKSKPILIIGSAWPEGRDYATYRAWRDELHDGASAVLFAGDTFPSLGEKELIDLARQFAPSSEEAMLRAIASKWPNPYALSLALSDPYFVADFVSDGRLEVSTEDIAIMPSSIRDLYRRRWRALPADVQDVLMLVAGTLPSSSADELLPYLQDVVLEASKEIPSTQGDIASKRTALHKAIEPNDWIRVLSATEEIQQFREPSLQTVAQEHFIENRGRHSQSLRDATSRVLRQLVPEQVGESVSPGVLLACRWLLAIDPNQDETTAMAALTLADAAGEGLQSARALELMTPERVALLCDSPGRGSYVQQQLAMWNLRDRRFRAALSALDQAISIADEYGSAHERRALESFRALPLAELGYADEAIAIHERAIQDLGSGRPEVWHQVAFHKRHLATALAQVGRTDEAVQALEGAARPIRERREGEHYSLGDLDVLNALGVQLVASGKAESAVRIFGDLLSALPVEPDTQTGLTIRANYAAALSQAGDPKGITTLRSVIQVRTKLLGANHPQTLLARAKLAQEELKSGSETALADLREVFYLQVQAGVRGNDLNLAGVGLIRCLQYGDEEAYVVAEALVRARHPDLDPGETRKRAVGVAMNLWAMSGERGSEMALQASALRASQLGDYAASVDLFSELADRLVDLGEGDLPVAIVRMNAIVNELPNFREDVSTPGQLEEKALDRIRQLDSIIPVIVKGTGEASSFTLTIRRTRVLLQIEARRLQGALVALRQIVPRMIETGHPEAVDAQGQMALLAAAAELTDRRLLRSIRSASGRDPTEALQQMGEAIGVLRAAGVLTEDDQQTALSQVQRLSLFVADAQHFRRGMAGVARSLQDILDEDFRR